MEVIQQKRMEREGPGLLCDVTEYRGRGRMNVRGHDWHVGLMGRSSIHTGKKAEHTHTVQMPGSESI